MLLYTHQKIVKDCKRIYIPLKNGLLTGGCHLIHKNVNCSELRTNKQHPILAQYTIQKETIREVTHAKYLGVTIDRKLSWSEY